MSPLAGRADERELALLPAASEERGKLQPAAVRSHRRRERLLQEQRGAPPAARGVLRSCFRRRLQRRCPGTGSQRRRARRRAHSMQSRPLIACRLMQRRRAERCSSRTERSAARLMQECSVLCRSSAAHPASLAAKTWQEALASVVASAAVVARGRVVEEMPPQGRKGEEALVPRPRHSGLPLRRLPAAAGRRARARCTPTLPPRSPHAEHCRIAVVAKRRKACRSSRLGEERCRHCSRESPLQTKALATCIGQALNGQAARDKTQTNDEVEE